MSTLNNNLSFAEIKKINISLYSFFEYINMPPICTSAIIIKNYLKKLVINNGKNINFKSLKNSVLLINLDWGSELAMLRNYLKDWFKSYYDDFKLKFENITPTLEKLNILKLLTAINNAYKLNKHVITTSLNLYNFTNQIEEKRIFERKLIRSYLLEQYNFFEKLEQNSFLPQLNPKK